MQRRTQWRRSKTSLRWAAIQTSYEPSQKNAALDCRKDGWTIPTQPHPRVLMETLRARLNAPNFWCMRDPEI